MHIWSELFQHADFWAEPQFSFLKFSFPVAEVCRVCRRQWSCGRTFLVLFSCCLFGFLFNWCVYNADNFSLQDSVACVLKTCLMSCLLSQKHERLYCLTISTQRCCKHNQHFRLWHPHNSSHQPQVFPPRTTSRCWQDFSVMLLQIQLSSLRGE